jgi:hypothetical protein
MEKIVIVDDEGLTQLYEKGSRIKISIELGKVVIKANKAGCLELAKHFLYLSQDKNLKGYHIHLDESNSLEDGSVETILELR